MIQHLSFFRRRKGLLPFVPTASIGKPFKPLKQTLAQ